MALLAVPASALRAQDTVTLTLVDELAPEEVDEVTAVSINHQTVATFRLDADHAAQTVQVTLPRADRYEYTMCGEARVRGTDGAVRSYRVNDSGEIADVAGRMFAAYTQGYVSFFLVEVTPGRPRTEIRTHQGPRCPVAVSRR